MSKHKKTHVDDAASPEAEAAPEESKLAEAEALRAELAPLFDEEQHPATKQVMERRKAEDTSEAEPGWNAARAEFLERRALIERLLKAGGHAPLCPCRSHGAAVCACGWGEVAAEARAALGMDVDVNLGTLPGASMEHPAPTEAALDGQGFIERAPDAT